jgi:GT2 family glycosyltransferase
MLFSAVILSYNSERTLLRCLESLSDSFSSFDGQSEILVFDNGSLDNSLQILNSFISTSKVDLKLFSSKVNTGTTVSRNTLLNASTGEYVLVFDSDAYITPKALEILKASLDNDPGLGMSVPKLFYGDSRFQMSTDVFPTLWHKAQRFLSLDKMQSDVDHQALVDTNVDYAISACWLLRRDAVDAVGGFDEAIFYSPEDVDYCMQVWAAGYKIRYITSAEVIHDAQELSRGFRLSFFHFSHLSGLFYLFKKYRYFFGLKGLYGRLGRDE